MKARELMTHPVVAVDAGTSAKEAARLLVDRGFAVLPVVDADERLIGVVGEADLLRNRILPDPRALIGDRPPEPAPPPPPDVAGVMTTDVVTAHPGTHVADLGTLMVEHRLRAIPVVDGDRLVGIVSRVDVLRTIARTDDTIAREVAAHLAAAGRRRWDVAVTDGVVTLMSEGADEADRHIAAVVAGCTPGVVDVRVRDGVADPARP